MGELSLSQIRDNARRVLERAAIAAERAGHEVTVVAASKMNDTRAVRAAYDAGIRFFGENRVQELEVKLSENAYAGASLHFIGRLQKNKVKNVVGRVDLIESADSAELLRLIGKKAVELGTSQDVLLEVNIGREEAKSGVAPEGLPGLVEEAAQIDGIFVRGLMAIPPVETKKEKTERYFEQMRKLFIDMSAKKYDNVTMSILSMGMSADFELAIACGANMVRVGSAIFGERHYDR